jgi:hypothetical protein
MKNFLCAVTVTCLGLAAVQAEGPGAPPSPGKGGLGGGEMRMRLKERFLESLPPEVRQRFEAAKAKALEDPKIQELRAGAEAANREFFKAMREKMMEIDPGLKEIVEKRAREGRGSKDKPREGRREGGRDGTGFANLTEAEKKQLMAAREKAKDDPIVQAATKAKDEAATPEARKAAGEEFRKAMHLALLKADPTLGPVLEKMSPKPPPSGPVPGEDREMMNP